MYDTLVHIVCCLRHQGTVFWIDVSQEAHPDVSWMLRCSGFVKKFFRCFREWICSWSSKQSYDDVLYGPIVIRKALFLSLSNLTYSKLVRAQCQSGAAYSHIGRMKSVHMRNKSTWDAHEDFNLDNVKAFSPTLSYFLVLQNHFRSSFITTNRFNSEARVKRSFPVFRAVAFGYSDEFLFYLHAFIAYLHFVRWSPFWHLVEGVLQEAVAFPWFVCKCKCHVAHVFVELCGILV